MKTTLKGAIDMMKITNVPHEVWLVALDYEDSPRPQDNTEPSMTYQNTMDSRGHTNGGLEKAIHEYMTLSGPFDETDGEFAGVGGYTVTTNG